MSNPESWSMLIIKDLIFEAGNEYRRFEMVTTKYKGMRVAELRYYDPYFNVTLFPDFPRAGKNYLYDQTQNGRFTIRMRAMRLIVTLKQIIL